MEAQWIQQRYALEREKRLRPEAGAQYIDIATTDRYKHWRDDPWVDHAALNALPCSLQEGSQMKFLILGAGYGGLLFAVRLIEAGIDRRDIRIADSAGGFGGTWYWNRYPGIQCDVESYIYMPLLEELEYMPKHKYAFGPELRAHANRIADRYGLHDLAAFRMEVKSMDWQENAKAWAVCMDQNCGPDEGIRRIAFQAQFVVSGPGVLTHPQAPKVEGLGNFKGHLFHTSRWDYQYTGGSEEDWTLKNLKDKTVGIIGTGATAIQCVPHLAKFAKHLYVFQRTPASVDRRDNRRSDADEWTQMTAEKGWQAARRWNWYSLVADLEPRLNVDMVDDGWSRARSISAILGAPGKGILQPSDLPSRIANLHMLDLPRQEAIRRRVDETVEDQATAEALKAWYPSWCKRPVFHDEYLPAFNQDNVSLIDTNGNGIKRLTEHGVVVGCKGYDLDCLIIGTGFTSPTNGNPAFKSRTTLKGRDGISIEEKWQNGMATLHGVCTNGFPNYFWLGTSQAGLDGNYTHSADQIAQHVAYILSESLRRGGDRAVVEPSTAAQENWAMQVAMRATGYAAGLGCTPSYYNAEGALDSITTDEGRLQAAKTTPWGDGFQSYVAEVERWRQAGTMEGLQVSA